jgi:hypothetical protein
MAKVFFERFIFLLLTFPDVNGPAISYYLMLPNKKGIAFATP